ncbi:Tetratricopeptide repeat-containing protein [Rickettsiales endosymbiont of Paramecium tredecaurelia]|uniref:tetratricopeptide repeat protein n=1 Tax=Candidatus Sarmatiella mevalonica TaxID=2770581 RepID=UPI0019238F2E|nr:tetratricopeptide repeat protein [Candidatus Sarmatiella mevalonica]MBL3284382.1 Tetratricopeptide repeat-containing protein [Candidatus Sarmatiella mevalonica]
MQNNISSTQQQTARSKRYQDSMQLRQEQEQRAKQQQQTKQQQAERQKQAEHPQQQQMQQQITQSPQQTQVILPEHAAQTQNPPRQQNLNVAQNVVSNRAEHSASYQAGFGAYLLNQIKHYTQLMKLEPTNPEHPFNKAQMLCALQRNAQAIEAYGKAIELGHNNADCYSRRGNEFYELKQYEEALKDFQKAIALEPGNGMYHYHKGNALCVLGRYEESIVAYDRAIALGWNDEGCRANKEYALSRLLKLPQKQNSNAAQNASDVASNRTERSASYQAGFEAYLSEQVKYYTRLMECDPANPEYPLNKARTLGVLQKNAQAIEAYSKAIELGYDNADCYCSRGNEFYELEQYEEALKDFQKAIALEPGNGMYHSYKGDALCVMERYEESIVAYDRAIALGWNDEGCRANKEYALSRLCNRTEGSASYQARYEAYLSEQVKYYTRLMECDPANPEHPFNKAQRLGVLQRNAEAIEAYGKAIELGKNHPDCYFRRGNEFYDLEQYEEALEDFKKAVALEPGNGRYHFHKGDALCVMERYEESIVAYDRAIALGWNDEGCRANREYALSQLLNPPLQNQETAYSSESEPEGA